MSQIQCIQIGPSQHYSSIINIGLGNSHRPMRYFRDWFSPVCFCCAFTLVYRVYWQIHLEWLEKVVVFVPLLCFLSFWIDASCRQPEWTSQLFVYCMAGRPSPGHRPGSETWLAGLGRTYARQNWSRTCHKKITTTSRFSELINSVSQIPEKYLSNFRSFHEWCNEICTESCIWEVWSLKCCFDVLVSISHCHASSLLSENIDSQHQFRIQLLLYFPTKVNGGKGEADMLLKQCMLGKLCINSMRVLRGTCPACKHGVMAGEFNVSWRLRLRPSVWSGQRSITHRTLLVCPQLK